MELHFYSHCFVFQAPHRRMIGKWPTHLSNYPSYRYAQCQTFLWLVLSVTFDLGCLRRKMQQSLLFCQHASSFHWSPVIFLASTLELWFTRGIPRTIHPSIHPSSMHASSSFGPLLLGYCISFRLRFSIWLSYVSPGAYSQKFNSRLTGNVNESEKTKDSALEKSWPESSHY